MSESQAMGRLDQAGRLLSPVALLAAMGLVAQSEWSLALAVGWPAYVAWLAPVALDAYVLAAVRSRKDMGPAVVVSSVSVLVSHAIYASPRAWASGVPGEGHLVPLLAASCSVVPLLVAWRIHNIDQKAKRPTTSRAAVKPRIDVPADAAAQPVASTAAPAPAANAGSRGLALVTQVRARPGRNPGARERAIADAQAWREQHGSLPTIKQLEDHGPHAHKTAQRALEHIKAKEAAA